VPYTVRGTAYVNRRQWTEALSDFTKATEISPQDAYAWSMRGKVHFETQQYDESVAAYTTAIELATQADQNPAYYWHERAWVYRGLQEWDKAIEDWTRAIKLEPRNGAAADIRLDRASDESPVARRQRPCLCRFL
jgi:tetratricopeptide (TPR) repeat protein